MAFFHLHWDITPDYFEVKPVAMCHHEILMLYRHCKDQRLRAWEMLVHNIQVRFSNILQI